MNIKTIIKVNPSSSELKKYQKFADGNWGEEHDPKEEIKDNFFDLPKIVILAFVKAKLVGLLNLHIRKISFGKKSIILGGVGGVVTHVNYRYKGVATKLLNKALKVLRSENAEVSLLCTDIPKLGSLYSKVGFVPLGKPYYFISKNGTEKNNESGMIAPVKSEQIFKSILTTKEKINIGLSNF